MTSVFCVVSLDVAVPSTTSVIDTPQKVSLSSAATFTKTNVRQKWPRLWSDLLFGLLSTPDNDVESGSLPLSLEKLIVSNQPQSGNLLLSVLTDTNHPTHRRAVNAFVNTWETMSPLQLRAYFQSAMRLTLRQRPTFPVGVPGAVGFDYTVNYGWSGWPKRGDASFPADNFKTHTTHFLDGKEHSTFDFQGPMATTEWIDTNNLSLGKHAVSSVIKYEYSYRGEKFEDEVRSPLWSFEIVADTKDDLVAAPDLRIDALVKRSFQVMETEQSLGNTSASSSDLPSEVALGDLEVWKPQVTWDGKDGLNGYHFPMWKMTQALPVDLCFETEIEDLETGKKFPGNSVIVPRGEVRNDYIYPDATDEFTQGRSGFVRIRITFKPSRMHALSDPRIKSYYGKSFSTDVMRAKLFEGDAYTRYEE